MTETTTKATSISPSSLSEEASAPESAKSNRMPVLLSRSRFGGAVAFNFVTFLLPAIYSTLSKLWVAHIDSSLVATTDSYTYASTITEVINEGLPRAAFLLIGNAAGRSLESRITLSTTLVSFQAFLGFLLSWALFAAARSFAAAFVPRDVIDASMTYVRISAFESLFSAISIAVSAATRSLDRPDVPLAINLMTVIANIILDFCFLSTFRPVSFNPSINTQAGIRLACDAFGALCGLAYFGYTIRRLKKLTTEPSPSVPFFRLSSLLILAQAGSFFFLESAIRNALYLWLVSTIVSLGHDYATAWGVFNTIRWGLIMVPVQTLEASSLVFVAHRWGRWCVRGTGRATASWSDLRYISHPAILSATIAVTVETVLCLLLSFWLIRPFAFYLSNSAPVADITRKMWRSIDWTYVVGYATTTQFATILSATQPWMYLSNSILSNFLYVLPWAIVMQVVDISPERAWFFYAMIFGGSLLFSILTVGMMLGVWAIRLRKGVDRAALMKGM
jgi:Na+-driven multidrug efflux pump